jgi:hypothetical protein
MRLWGNSTTDDTDDEQEEAGGDEHTPENPYCSNPACWCHSDSDYHAVVIQPVATEEQYVQARSFFGLF